VHYLPRTAILNNLEFDHADIFADLDAIKTQFHHFVRTIPGNGLVVANQTDTNISDVLEKGCWSPINYFAGDNAWFCKVLDATSFEVYQDDVLQGIVQWALTGKHNRDNALAAIAAANHAGVKPKSACLALAKFQNVKRRMELRAVIDDVHIYDDFAHHPTAITTTLAGLRSQIGSDRRLLAVLEPRSNTMQMGFHKELLATSLMTADQIFLYQPPTLSWSLAEMIEPIASKTQVADDVTQLLDLLVAQIQQGDYVVIMSNGGFENFHARLIERLSALEKSTK
jgi:UDP-N-acetylmuramate: L-alanyl-gamma-D-glutamyl-meso-diaminopimelate ligase